MQRFILERRAHHAEARKDPPGDQQLREQGREMRDGMRVWGR